MNTYYLPNLLSIEDYQVMANRFHRIINAMPEFSKKKTRGSVSNTLGHVRTKCDSG